MSLSAAVRLVGDRLTTPVTRTEARQAALDAVTALGIGDGVVLCDYAEVGTAIMPTDPLVSTIRYHGVFAGLRRYVAQTGDRYRSHVAHRLRAGANTEAWSRVGRRLEPEARDRYRQMVHRPARVHDYVRAYAADGRHVLGFIATVRDDGTPRFVDRDVEQLRLLEPYVVRLLRVGWRRRASERHGPAHLVCDARGTVLHATAAAARWLDRPQARGAVCRAVSERQSEGEVPPASEGRALIVLPLEGCGPTRWLVHLPSAPFPTLRPIDALTNRQRQVAELAGLGLTSQEVGRDLGIATGTAKAHLKAVYAELGITSRAELARLLPT
jgi:DNA-binding CsgD family transcriptional regulator